MKTYYTRGLIGLLLIIGICSALPALGQGQKVSERTALSAENLAPGTDVVGVVDISAGASGSKKITINNLFTGWGFTTAGEDLAKASNVAAQRSLLNLGTAALMDHGTAAGDVVRLDATTGKLPAVDGSLLTNLPSGTALTDSASLRTALSDETGSGLAVFGTSPTIGTPVISSPTINLGSDAAGDLLYRSSGGGLTRLAAGTDGHVLTLASGLPTWAAGAGGAVEGTAILSTGETGGTKFLREDGDGTSSWVTLSGGGDALVANPLSQFASTTSSQLAGVVSDETGTGVAVFGTSPTIGSPTISTPTVNIGSDATGDILYRSSGGGLTRLGAGTDGHVLTLSGGLPSWAASSGGTTLTDSASLRTALSDETGTGVAVFGTSPTIATPTINIGSDATGDILYRSSGGGLTRLAAGTDGHVLTLASGLPTWAAGGGGGGLTNWTDDISTSSPNATVPVASLAATNAATNVDIALVPKGTGAITARVADSTTAGGNKRGANAVDLQTTRSSSIQVASGANSVVIGGGTNKATGSYTSVMGSGNTASGDYSTVLGGFSSDATGLASAVIGGGDNVASGSYSMASGNYSTTRGLYGVAARAAGRYSAEGDAQVAEYILLKSVTSATPAEATLGGQSASSTTRIVLPNNSSYGFKVHATARKSDGTTKIWRQEGAIKRGANAAATALVGSITEAVNEDAGASSWDLNLSADTTNGTLDVDVVGDSSGTTRFVIRVETVEIVY